MEWRYEREIWFGDGDFVLRRGSVGVRRQDDISGGVLRFDPHDLSGSQILIARKDGRAALFDSVRRNPLTRHQRFDLGYVSAASLDSEIDIELCASLRCSVSMRARLVVVDA